MTTGEALWMAWVTVGAAFFIVGGAAGLQIPMTHRARQAQRAFMLTCLFTTLVCFAAATAVSMID